MKAVEEVNEFGFIPTESDYALADILFELFLEEVKKKPAVEATGEKK